MLASQLQAAEIAAGQLLGLFTMTAVPDWADCMEDPLRWQTEGGGSFGIAGSAAAELSAGFQQLRTRGTMDGTIYTSTAEKGRIRRIHNSIDVLFRYIAAYHLQVSHIPLRCQKNAQTAVQINPL